MEKVFSQSELEAIARALADTSDGLTGTEIGHILSTLKMVDPSQMMTKWKRLHNAFVKRQNDSKNRRAILEFIRQAMKPERYVHVPERFELMRANVNRALGFSGLAVDASGTLQAVAAVTTLTEAAQRAQKLRADLLTRGVPLKLCLRDAVVASQRKHIMLLHEYSSPRKSERSRDPSVTNPA